VADVERVGGRECHQRAGGGRHPVAADQDHPGERGPDGQADHTGLSELAAQPEQRTHPRARALHVGDEARADPGQDVEAGVQAGVEVGRDPRTPGQHAALSAQQPPQRDRQQREQRDQRNVQLPPCGRGGGVEEQRVGEPEAGQYEPRQRDPDHPDPARHGATLAACAP